MTCHKHSSGTDQTIHSGLCRALWSWMIGPPTCYLSSNNNSNRKHSRKLQVLMHLANHNQCLGTIGCKKRVKLTLLNCIKRQSKNEKATRRRSENLYFLYEAFLSFLRLKFLHKMLANLSLCVSYQISPFPPHLPN